VLGPAIARFGNLIFGLVIAGVGALVFSLSWNSSGVQEQLEAHGVYGTATIDAKQAAPYKAVGGMKDGEPMIRLQYFVSYSFQAGDGSTYASEAMVSETFFLRSEIGASTPVRYVPDNPGYSEVEFGHMVVKNYLGLSGGGLLLLIGLGFAGFAISDRRR
jgi:hypothetical protein